MPEAQNHGRISGMSDARCDTGQVIKPPYLNCPSG